MIRYCPRAMYETFRPGINRMVNSMHAEGLPIPPIPLSDRVAVTTV